MAVRTTAVSTTTVATSTTPNTSIAEQARAAASQHGNHPLQLGHTLYGLCASIRTWEDWHAVHQAGKDLPPSILDHLTDKLDPLLIVQVNEWKAKKDALAQLSALNKACLRQRAGEQRAALVARLAPAIDGRINTLMDACCSPGADAQTLRSAQDVLGAWASLAADGSSLKVLILDAQSALENLSPPPPADGMEHPHAATASLPPQASVAQRAKACVQEHPNNPLQLVRALYALTDEVATWQDWLALHEATQLFVGSLHEALTDKLSSLWSQDWSGRIADAAGLSEAERQSSYQFCRSLPPSPQRDALIQTIPGPGLPSGRGLQAITFPHAADKFVEVWPLVFKQFFRLDKPAEDLKAAGSMSGLNRWFHRHMGGFMPQLALHSMQSSNWPANLQDEQTTERWTRLPLSTFLQWTQDSDLPDEERLLRLLRTMLGDFGKNSKVHTALEQLWETYFKQNGPVKAAYASLPRLIAQALMPTPVQASIHFPEATKMRVFEWLSTQLHGLESPQAAPAWVELGLGAQTRLLILDHSDGSWIHRFVNGDTFYKVREASLEQLSRWPASAEGLIGIATLLLSNQPKHFTHKLNARYGMPTGQQLSSALSFLREFSQTHPLQGSLRAAIDILQDPTSGITLDDVQQKLLEDCLLNDATHRAPKALALV